MIRLFQILTFVAMALTIAKAQDAQSTLGMPVVLRDVYIPGGKAEPIPRKDRESSIVVRILEIKPADKGHRYDIEVYGLDPGTHKLADFLQYTHGSEKITGLTTTIEIRTAHPTNTLPKPVEIPHTPPEKLGGYSTLLKVACAIWFIVLLVILFYRKKTNQQAEATPPPTLHQKLSALIATASQGDLDDSGRAELERLVIGHWKQKLPELASLSPSEALVRLRQHPEASPLILKIEQWLHAPNPSVRTSEIEELLQPYRQS